MRTIVTRTCFIAAIAAAFGTQVSVSAQAPATTPEAFLTPAVGGSARQHISLLAAGLQAASQAVPLKPPADDGRPVRRLTADEAVKLALENNLGIQVARFDPRIEDLNVAAARGWYARRSPRRFRTTASSALGQHLHRQLRTPTSSRTTSPSNIGVTQTLPWGGTLRRRLGQLAIDKQQQRQHVAAAAQLIARVQLPAVAAARLDHRQHPAAARRSV